MSSIYESTRRKLIGSRTKRKKAGEVPWQHPIAPEVEHVERVSLSASSVVKLNPTLALA